VGKIDALLDDVADAKIPLSGTLLKAKIVGADIPDEKFSNWLCNESVGYTRYEDLPDYRRMKFDCLGEGIGSMGHIKNVPLQLHKLPDQLRQPVETYCFYQNVGQIEGYLKQKMPEAYDRIDSEILHELGRYWDLFPVRGYKVTDAWRVIPTPAFERILTTVRNRLLDFLLELKRKHPDIVNSEGGVSSVAAEELSSMVNHFFYRDCTFTGGTTVAKQSVNAGGNISVGGHFIVADEIRNSFNAVEASSTSNDLKTALKALGDAVAKMSEELPQDKQQDAAQDYNTVSVEVIKPKPRKAMISAALEGLKTTASVAVKYGPQVAGLIGTVHELIKNW
jgi:hypothetical protein